MRRRVTIRLSCVIAAVAVVFAPILTAAASAAPAPQYVALGDSYSSGVGTGTESGSCLRGSGAFPALWAAAHAPASFTFAACSGATTSTVNTTQLAALGAATTLVSITVGGNDVGFSSIMTTCVLQGTSACVTAVTSAETKAQTVLPALLDTTYSGITARAPAARVVVLDYPVFYDLSAWWCIGLSGTSRSKIDEGIGVLDGVLASAAARHGFVFADVRSAFGAGHEVCDGSSWLHSLNVLDLTESYHPTAAGQSGGYLPAFTAAAATG